MKIIFSGAPLFAKKLTQHLQDYDKNNNYLYINIKEGIFQRLRFYFHMLNSDILHVTYVDAYFMKSVDFALKFKKKIILSWIGTDVSNAIPKIKEKTFNQNYIDHVTHVTASKCLRDELYNEVGIDALYLPNIIITTQQPTQLNYQTKFSALTRIAKNREIFYGIETIKKLALDFPNIQFNIAGIDNYPDLPSNIRCLGWIDVNKELLNCSVFIRYMEHDGESHAVIEALSLGKPVLYNYDFPHTFFIQDYEQLKSNLDRIIKMFNDNRLIPNKQAVEYIKKNYNKDYVLQQYIDLFNKLGKQ